MLKGERGFLVFVLGCLFLAAFAWMMMRPQAPHLPTNKYIEAQETMYSPGSPACLPSRLEALSEKDAADEKYRCEIQAERERIQSSDLVQQTRSADAAAATVNLTYRQMLIDLAGAIFGVLTVLAAGYAAFYARRAAEAGRGSNEIARENARHQLRAYMTSGDISLNSITINGNRLWEISHSWKNTGQTPAQLVSTNFNWVDFPAELPTRFDYPDENDEARPDPSPVGPNQTLGNRPVVIGDERFREARHGKCKIFLWGWAEYQDIFSGGEWRRTEFCYEVGIIGVDGAQQVAFIPYGLHNGMDEGCLKWPLSKPS